MSTRYDTNYSCKCDLSKERKTKFHLCLGASGFMCDINHDDCTPGACHNNGTCVDKVGGFECKCPPGFVGPRCEGDINECLSNPCNPFGTQDCVQLVNNFHCNCKPGYMGRKCESKVNFCEHAPCQNGGVCSALESGHSCHCRPGYFGRNCEFIGNSCDSNPCMNRGNCIPQEGGSYRCECLAGLYLFGLRLIWYFVVLIFNVCYDAQDLLVTIASLIPSTSARVILASIMEIVKTDSAIMLVSVNVVLPARIAKFPTPNRGVD